MFATVQIAQAVEAFDHQGQKDYRQTIKMLLDSWWQMCSMP